jgi:hypothetical protein
MLGRWFMAAMLVCGCAAAALGADNALETLNLGENASSWGPVLVRYVPALATIINTPIPNELDMKEIRVAKLRLSPKSTDTLIVDYSEGASADPCFIIHRIEECGPRRLAPGIDGLEFEAPGDGFFYVRGHVNSWFDVRRKFAVVDGNLREVRQPYYYIGLETRTIDQIKLYSRESCIELIGYIPKGAPVTVVLSDGWDFLLKTDHDVLGWWRPRNTSQHQRAQEIEGVFFRGD